MDMEMVQVEWTQEANARLVEYLARNEYEIPVGLGTEEAACSVAAINLALSGEFTDRVPDCMSKIIGVWIIRMQDVIPAEIRNSREWKELLPLSANTGREWEQEKKRLDIIVEWLWSAAIPLAQTSADEEGYGDAFRIVCKERTAEALNVLGKDDSYIATHIASHITSFVNIYDSLCNSEYKDYDIEDAIEDAIYIVKNASFVAASIATDVECLATDNGDNTIWDILDPVGTLRRLVSV